MQVLEPPTKRVKSGSPLACGRCKQPPSKVAWAFFDDHGSCIGNACKRCHRPWCLGYKQERSWEEHCDKCDEDPVYNDEATIAAAVLAYEVLAPWQQSEVMDESTFELVTTRSFIGIARSEFTSLVGHAPSEAQVTETDMPAER